MLANFIADPYLHIGPPAKELASAGRMNPDGVPVFYGATDIETCLAEMRPALGTTVAVIELITDKAHRILDFSRLENARGGQSLSYFQQNYWEELRKQAFLKHIHRLISQPVIPGKESEYLITQTLSEYLAHVHQSPFDGILFKSTQREAGVNIVLFQKYQWHNGFEFNLSYSRGSLRLFETTSIKYQHEELDFPVNKDAEYFLDGDIFDDDIPF